jgi:hypothetical protein
MSHDNTTPLHNGDTHASFSTSEPDPRARELHPELTQAAQDGRLNDQAFLDMIDPEDTTVIDHNFNAELPRAVVWLIENHDLAEQAGLSGTLLGWLCLESEWAKMVRSFVQSHPSVFRLVAPDKRRAAIKEFVRAGNCLSWMTYMLKLGNTRLTREIMLEMACESADGAQSLLITICGSSGMPALHTVMIVDRSFLESALEAALQSGAHSEILDQRNELALAFGRIVLPGIKDEDQLFTAGQPLMRPYFGRAIEGIRQIASMSDVDAIMSLGKLRHKINVAVNLREIGYIEVVYLTKLLLSMRREHPRAQDLLRTIQQTMLNNPQHAHLLYRWVLEAGRREDRVIRSRNSWELDQRVPRPSRVLKCWFNDALRQTLQQCGWIIAKVVAQRTGCNRWDWSARVNETLRDHHIGFTHEIGPRRENFEGVEEVMVPVEPPWEPRTTISGSRFYNMELHPVGPWTYQGIAEFTRWWHEKK